MAKNKIKKLCVFLMAAIVFIGAAAPSSYSDEAEKSSEKTIKSVYKDYFLVGNIAEPRDFYNGNLKTLVKHFDIITPANMLKPDVLAPEKRRLNFYASDQIVNALILADLKVHGHTLVWSHWVTPKWFSTMTWRNGNPGYWVKGRSYSREQAIANMTNHVKNVIRHYQGRIFSWDVVNETIAVYPSKGAGKNDTWQDALPDSGMIGEWMAWIQAIGPEYVELAFMAAREADPDIILYYNDDYTPEKPPSQDNRFMGIYKLIKDINERYPDYNKSGRPLIDAVGIQSHFGVNANPEYMRQALEMLLELDLKEIAISELDILGREIKKGDPDPYTLNRRPPLNEAEAVNQGRLYAKMFRVFRQFAQANPGKLKRVTIWGLEDNESWGRYYCPVLFDDNFNPKPAFYAVLDPDGFLAEYGE
ncbi:MAG: endo-1,4-beta-xylanase [Treponema sp.]|nr:endo-1,4-beta-xylanase [Treponema sp.]